jgi:uncharacterized protein
MEYQSDLLHAKARHPENQRLVQRLKRTKPKDLDDQFHELHHQAFQEIDCLQCANCCKTTSPIFIPADIDRLAKTFRMKPSTFVDTYLKVDQDNDYVLKNSPCPFLAPDNTCIVYDDRPRACREYPHTNRKRMYQILDLTLKNTLVCPAVARIVNKLEQS